MQATPVPAVSTLVGLGTGVATALAVNVGSAGAPVVNGGALGTPSSGVATNLTGTAAGLTAGVASAVAVGGITGLGTGVATGLAGAWEPILGQPSGGAVVIPGLSGSPDIRVAGASDDEFDTTDTSDPMTGWTTLGTPTAHDINNTVKSNYYVKQNATASVGLVGIYKACPNIPFTMTAKLSGCRASGDYNVSGIFIAENPIGKIVHASIQYHSSNFTTQPRVGLNIEYYTNRTTFNANVGFLQGLDAPIYLRIVVTSSSNVAYQFSKDGFVWRTVVSAHNPGFTVGSVGLMTASANATHAGEAVFDWVRFT